MSGAVGLDVDGAVTDDLDGRGLHRDLLLLGLLGAAVAGLVAVALHEQALDLLEVLLGRDVADGLVVGRVGRGGPGGRRADRGERPPHVVDGHDLAVADHETFLAVRLRAAGDAPEGEALVSASGHGRREVAEPHAGEAVLLGALEGAVVTGHAVAGRDDRGGGRGRGGGVGVRLVGGGLGGLGLGLLLCGLGVRLGLGELLGGGLVGGGGDADAVLHDLVGPTVGRRLVVVPGGEREEGEKGGGEHRTHSNSDPAGAAGGMGNCSDAAREGRRSAAGLRISR